MSNKSWSSGLVVLFVAFALLIVCPAAQASRAFSLPSLRRLADDTKDSPGGAPAHTEAEVRALFTAFKTSFNKTYATAEEEEKRFGFFRTNVDLITLENAGAQAGGASFDINEFADRSMSELEASLLAGIPANFTSVMNATLQEQGFLADQFEVAADVPPSVDWVAQGKVGPIQMQGVCGSCYSFSAMAALESLHAIQTGQVISLSPQQGLDCAAGNFGCSGGFPSKVFDMVAQRGAAAAASYPYVGAPQGCKAVPAVVRASGSRFVPPNNEQALMQAVAKQPTVVQLDASGSFLFYKGGVFNGPCGNSLNHAVLLVGYGNENGQDYWLVKNSWGTTWGAAGYMKIGRGANRCGLASVPVYPY